VAKILFLGNNDDSTDRLVTELAKESSTVNHGLISQPEFIPDQPGYYHTTVMDLSWGALISVAHKNLTQWYCWINHKVNGAIGNVFRPLSS